MYNVYDTPTLCTRLRKMLSQHYVRMYIFISDSGVPVIEKINKVRLIRIMVDILRRLSY